MSHPAAALSLMSPPSGPIVLPTHDLALFDAAVEQAAALLKAGEAVAIPTETVYGLAANALDPEAVRRLFRIKERPEQNPIIVHVGSREMARRTVRLWPPIADALAQAFWPGPLTLVLPRASEIPPIVTAGGDTVGIRWPSHPLMQAVIRACGFPLAAPSANLASQLSPTTAEHVRRGLGDRVKLIVDGGSCQVGIESTVLDLTANPPQVLRPGMIRAESLAAVTGALGTSIDPSGSHLKSPGLLPKHYAPKATLRVWGWTDTPDLLRQLTQANRPARSTHIIAHTRIPAADPFAGVSVIPHDAEAFGRALYAELHRCDDSDVPVIVVEAIPPEPEWEAIADRLRRAATP